MSSARNCCVRLGEGADGGTDVMAFAMEDAYVEGTADDAGGDAHPAHVHNGNCDAPADVIFPLGDINVVVVGGETNGYWQIMGATYRTTVSIDKWR